MKKRTGFLLISLSILMIFTAACGSTSNKQSAAKKNDMITYQDAKGEVKLPKNPKRIVLLAESYYGDLVTLGKTPVATTSPIFKNPFYKGKTDGVKNLGRTPSVEKVAALKPDMIIAWGEDEKFDQYKKIAPTVAVKYNQYSFKDQLKEFGKMTGTPKKATEWITKWDTKIAEVKPKVTKAVGSKTVSIVSPFDKGIYIFGNTFGRGGEIIYDELKLKAPKVVKKEAIDSGVGYANISLEKLPEFAGDYIFTGPWSGSKSNGDQVYQSSIWSSLPAVKNKRVFEIDPVGYFFNDPVSLEGQLEFIVDRLTSAS
ncbi:iron-hydroxamate ABC transporter substrate-binding protein [Bacillus safensis]|uniref:iron-hydroxamate ABC transporter substrate-binding protein n=1 Tax=Bacillus TaxID=1386 RepID=UPI000877A00F|nr:MULTISPECIES: iron-hydroxamate ABC transporter substrate-binding protein [Bacillus]MBU8604288.1 iron-hydroxamate ABC transporter substrate-binding protein [Bacillus safensis]MBU8616257.1 iron-hydroxamate ABC transporter substrate-binding protein [Bacillus safensis]MBU8627385.1 iron-hydroxamate ABC transporter substrate-binding protein [Bacillus safensis]MCY7465027.1 iron-hydroxamate ABC transporter substrate-binding protein [Bacillus safensis]MCY7523683.1 iron-hydroxamate ABC transporter su